MSKVYIAGPMTGLPAYNFEMFYAAEAELATALGLPLEDIGNPARHDAEVAGITDLHPHEQGLYLLDNPGVFSLEEAQRYDLDYIQNHADSICLLPGWEKSTGARAEAHLALWLGHTFYTYRPHYDLVLLSRDAAKALLMNLSINEAAAYRDSTDAARPVSGNEVRTTSSTGGQKGVKLARYDLIPVGPLKALAEHYGRGAAKYADHQWRNGYEWSKSIAALDRHKGAFWGGEDYDTCPSDGEGCQHVDQYGDPFHALPSPNGPTCYNHTGSHHLDGMMWHAFALREFVENFPEHDDRYRRNQ